MFEPVESECDSDDTDSDDPAVQGVDTGSGSRGGRLSTLQQPLIQHTTMIFFLFPTFNNNLS